ncbi:hypothetical protein [Sporosalibacterium faouarense]|uniref:hypothetical protein n=1 Tax=Sporosalibacterium faouarense TaxID=516123 RepID=UPI00141C451A|nr:hypothetical protein [Sporosalibacterium faouarense]MTI48888.1 hypothetical protein [Bacillota bacterium]
MGNNIINIILIILIITIFLGYFIIMDMTFKDKIDTNLKLAETYAKEEKWNKVLEVTYELKDIWKKHKHLLMFNFAEAEFTGFENHLNYIIGGAEAKQLDITLSNILTAQEQWTNAKKLVPEP